MWYSSGLSSERNTSSPHSFAPNFGKVTPDIEQTRSHKASTTLSFACRRFAPKLYTFPMFQSKYQTPPPPPESWQVSKVCQTEMRERRHTNTQPRTSVYRNSARLSTFPSANICHADCLLFQVDWKVAQGLTAWLNRWFNQGKCSTRRRSKVGNDQHLNSGAKHKTGSFKRCWWNWAVYLLFSILYFRCLSICGWSGWVLMVFPHAGQRSWLEAGIEMEESDLKDLYRVWLTTGQGAHDIRLETLRPFKRNFYYFSILFFLYFLRFLRVVKDLFAASF